MFLIPLRLFQTIVRAHGEFSEEYVIMSMKQNTDLKNRLEYHGHISHMAEQTHLVSFKITEKSRF